MAITLAVFLNFPAGASAFQNPDVTMEQLKEHIRFLASDSLQGRKTGTVGNIEAAMYLAGYFKEYGLTPAGDNGTYLQKFPFVSGAKPGPGNALTIEYGESSRSFILDESFRTLAFSSDTAISGGLVFAGYGITDTSQQYDDYAEIDVKGRIVIL